MKRNEALAVAGANIDAMVRGYLECQLWAQLDMQRTDDNDNSPTLDKNYSIEDISEDYVQSVRDRLTLLVVEHPLAVRMYLAKRNAESFGHDFYLTRERHGAGFWDRGLGDLGQYWTDISKWAGSAVDLWDNGSGVLGE